MKIPFVGASYTARSPNASAQRSVNCYLEYQKQDDGTSRPVALYGTPGLDLLATLGDSPVRQGLFFSDSYAYVVAGSHVYRIDTSYTATSCGTIGTSTGEVGMASNGTEVLIVDGDKGWLATGTTLTQITDVDFPNGVTRCAYIDGFFIVTGDCTQKFYWNETPGSGAAWNGLDFASAEGSPDNTVTVVSDHMELWLTGSRSGEIWVPDATATFVRDSNRFIEYGTAAAGTVRQFDDSVMWLVSGKDGAGYVVRAQGYRPVRVSNHALEHAIAGYSAISDAFAFTFNIEGHSFYALFFPTADASWLYDAATDNWFEWAWRDPNANELHRHRANCCFFFNGRHLVGDWETGKLYALNLDTYSDNGDPILRLRRTQTLNSTSGRLFFADLTIDMETGVGLEVGQGSDPQLMLRYSNNDGHTWSNIKTKSVGAVGEYGKRVKFGPTGCTKPAKGRVWEISMTDPVKFAVFGADATVVEGK